MPPRLDLLSTSAHPGNGLPCAAAQLQAARLGFRGEPQFIALRRYRAQDEEQTNTLYTSAGGGSTPRCKHTPRHTHTHTHIHSLKRPHHTCRTSLPSWPRHPSAARGEAPSPPRRAALRRACMPVDDAMLEGLAQCTSSMPSGSLKSVCISRCWDFREPPRLPPPRRALSCFHMVERAKYRGHASCRCAMFRHLGLPVFSKPGHQDHWKCSQLLTS